MTRDNRDGLIILAIILALTPFFLAWQGFVTSVLWGWFVAEQFGVRPIGVLQAIGLGIIVTAFTHGLARRSDVTTGDKYAKLGRLLAEAAMFPALSLLFGWIVHSLMT